MITGSVSEITVVKNSKFDLFSIFAIKSIRNNMQNNSPSFKLEIEILNQCKNADQIVLPTAHNFFG